MTTQKTTKKFSNDDNLHNLKEQNQRYSKENQDLSGTKSHNKKKKKAKIEKEELEQLYKELELQEEQIKLLASTGMQVHEENQRLKKRIRHYEKLDQSFDFDKQEKQDLREQIEELEIYITEFEKRNEFLMEKLGLANEDNQKYLSQVIKTEEINEKLRNEIRKEKKVTTETQELKEKLEQFQHTTQQLEQLKKIQHKLQQQLSQERIGKTELENDNIDLSNENIQFKKTIKSLKEKINDNEEFIQQTENLQKQLEELKLQNYWLEQLSLQNAKTYESIIVLVENYKKNKNEKENNQLTSKGNKQQQEKKGKNDFSMNDSIYPDDPMFKDTELALKSIGSTLYDESNFFSSLNESIQLSPSVETNDIVFISSEETPNKRRILYLTYLIFFQYRITQLYDLKNSLTTEISELRDELAESGRKLKLENERRVSLENLLRSSELSLGEENKERIAIEDLKSRLELELQNAKNRENELKKQNGTLKNMNSKLEEANKQTISDHERDLKKLKNEWQKAKLELIQEKVDLKNDFLEKIEERDQLFNRQKEKMEEKIKRVLKEKEQDAYKLRQKYELEINDLKFQSKQYQQGLTECNESKQHHLDNYKNKINTLKEETTRLKDQHKVQINYFNDQISILEEKLKDKEEQSLKERQKRERAETLKKELEKTLNVLKKNNATQLSENLQLNKENSKLNQTNKNLQENLEILQKQLEELINTQNNDDDNDNKHNDNDDEKLNQNILYLRSEINNLKIEHQRELELIQQENKKLLKEKLHEISKLKKDIRLLSKRLTFKEEEIKLLQSHRKKIEDRLQIYKSKIEKDAKLRKQYNDELHRLKKENSIEAKKMKKEIGKLKKKMELKEQRRKILFEKYSKFEELLKIAKEKLKTNYKEKKTLKKELSKLENLQAGLSRENLDLKNQVSLLEKQIEKLKQQLEDALNLPKDQIQRGKQLSDNQLISSNRKMSLLERMLIKYINSELSSDLELKGILPIGVKTSDLSMAVENGILLCKLINKCFPNTIDERVLNHFNDNSQVIKNKNQNNNDNSNNNISSSSSSNKNKSQIDGGDDDEEDIIVNEIRLSKLENHTLCINSAKAIGCQAFEIEPKALLDGDLQACIHMTWEIIKQGLFSRINLKSHPELFVLCNKSENIQVLMKMAPEEILLRWVNYHLKTINIKKKVNKFGTEFTDSTIYALLLSQVAPDECPIKPFFETESLEKRAHLVVKYAKKIHATQFLSHESIAAGNEKLNLAFLAHLFEIRTGLESQKRLQLQSRRVLQTETREERSFRLWINSLGVKPNVYHLYEDLKDGLILCQVIDKIGPKKIVNWKKIKMEGINVFEKVVNCEQSIQSARKLGLKITTSARDIIDTNKKFVLGLIWQLMRYDVMNILKNLQVLEGFKINDTHLVQWANKKVESSSKKGSKNFQQIINFRDVTLSTGIFIIDLIYSISPKSVNYKYVTHGRNDQAALKNARYAITLTRKLGGSVFLLPEDIVEVKDKMILTLVGELMKIDKIFHSKKN
ncbi:fimbrin-1 [Anaeramoeba flamelloides]|uniref:Fimbrin-1 n=1 Tax=Anaeramoeba flamelloides TaxID=1746091 RepID=A0AAV7YKU3_9EUKA|nr:fimbrin-1 [Anaeramoeba flamelloides]